MPAIVKVSALIMVVCALATMSVAFVSPASAVQTTPTPAKTVMIFLYTSRAADASGWGFGPTNMTNPGPTVTVTQGDQVMFHLFSQDHATHMLVIDLDGTATRSSGDAVSDSFNASTEFFFNADSAGTFSYFCGMSEGAMFWGAFVVGPAGPATDNTPLFVGGGILLAAVVGFAVYRVRRFPEPKRNRRRNQRSRNGRATSGKHSARDRNRSGH